MNNVFKKLGYEENEYIGIRKYLAYNSFKDDSNLYKNALYLMQDFDKEILLKLISRYYESFMIGHSLFKERFDKFKAIFTDDFNQIVIDQLLDYENTTVLDAIKTDKFEEVLKSLKNPLSYSFIDDLNEKGFKLTTDDFFEDSLNFLESRKYTLSRNVDFLLSNNYSKQSISELLINYSETMEFTTRNLKQFIEELENKEMENQYE